MSCFNITLRNLRYFAAIGVSEQERKVGNEFCVDVEFRVDASEFETERLDTSVSYADVYDIIKNSMHKEWMLLESVSKEIGDHIFELDSKILSVKVKVRKLSVPLSGFTGEAEVEYVRG